MANKVEDLAAGVVESVGGTSNVRSLTHCATRLRFVLVDDDRADLDVLRKVPGVLGVARSGGQTQVIIGTEVSKAYAAAVQLGAPALDGTAGAAERTKGTRRNPLSGLFEVIAALFTPIIFPMAGAGMLKGLLILFTTAGWLSAESGTYIVLYGAADGFFYFLPVILAFTAASKFKAERFVSVAIAAALVYPTLTAAYSDGSQLDFLGIPIVLASYTNSVIPIILAVYAQSKLELVLKKYVPSILNVLIPLVTLIIMVPVTFLAIGPVASWLGSILAGGYTALVALNPIIAGFLLGGLWPFIVMFGLHYGFVPIVFNNIATYGRDTLFTITGPHNMAQGGATLGVFLKTKNRSLKQLAGSTSLIALVAGVTEPAIYGVNLKYKRPFYIGAVFSAIAGAIVASVGAGSSAFVGTGLLTLPAYLGVGFVGFLIACAIAYFGAAIVTYFFGFKDSMIDPADHVENAVESAAPVTTNASADLIAPVNGRAIPLDQVADPAFSSGQLGKGIAIEPTDGHILSPADGEVVTVFPTGHAFGIKTDAGLEVLVHIGLDTVSLNGEGFTAQVKAGDRVRIGEEIVNVDLAALRAKGVDMTTCLVVTNSTTVTPPALSGEVVAGKSVVLMAEPVAEAR